MHFVISLVSTTKNLKIGHSQFYDIPLIKNGRSQALFFIAVNNSYAERIFVCLSTILNVKNFRRTIKNFRRMSNKQNYVCSKNILRFLKIGL